MKDGEHIWIIYDERGHDDAERAIRLATCDTIQEVCSYKPDFDDNSPVYRYTFKDGVAGNETYLGRLGDCPFLVMSRKVKIKMRFRVVEYHTITREIDEEEFRQHLGETTAWLERKFGDGIPRSGKLNKVYLTVWERCNEQA